VDQATAGNVRLELEKSDVKPRASSIYLERAGNGRVRRFARHAAPVDQGPFARGALLEARTVTV
jgi:hypothetical protein